MEKTFSDWHTDRVYLKRVEAVSFADICLSHTEPLWFLNAECHIWRGSSDTRIQKWIFMIKNAVSLMLWFVWTGKEHHCVLRLSDGHSWGICQQTGQRRSALRHERNGCWSRGIHHGNLQQDWWLAYHNTTVKWPLVIPSMHYVYSHCCKTTVGLFNEGKFFPLFRHPVQPS